MKSYINVFCNEKNEIHYTYYQDENIRQYMMVLPLIDFFLIRNASVCNFTKAQMMHICLCV